MNPFWASVYVADETHPFSLRDANPGKPATTLFQELQLARNHTSLFVPRNKQAGMVAGKLKLLK